MSNAGRHPRVCYKEAVHVSSRRQTLAKSAIFLPLTSNSSLRHRNDPMNAAQSIRAEAVKRTFSRASRLGAEVTDVAHRIATACEPFRRRLHLPP